MRLKSIKLVGFKSFVDSTVVPFPSNMTGIVGPNGCGKSNVIDAVRWVMGESSAKHLRGESMTDVIFNGSTHRQPVGKASIELLFDNADGQLVGEHAAFTEIAIKRQVTREGVSQYFLNGTKCRRRDVTDIFLGTGMGPRSYAIIEQGMISRLIESKPEELRVYLEEAAGISKYKERRRETENRIRRTQENLDRLTDIRDELGKQLSTLKRQAGAAERFKELKAEERSTKAQLAVVEWNALDGRKDEHLSGVGTLEQSVEDLVLEKATGQARIEVARAQLDEALDTMQEMQAKYYKSGAEIAKIEQELKFEKQRAERASTDKRRVEDDLDAAKHRCAQLKQTLDENRLALDETIPELEFLAEEQMVLSLRAEESEAAFEAWLACNDTLQSDYSEAKSLLDGQRTKLVQAEAGKAQHVEKLATLEDERVGLALELSELEDDEDGAVLAALEVQHVELSEALLGAEDINAEVSERCRELETQVSDSRSLLSSEKAVLASLQALQEDALSRVAVADSSVVEKLKALALPKLLDRLSIDGSWSSVVEAVLGESLHGFVGSESCLDGLIQDEDYSSAFCLFLEADGVAEAAAPGSLAEMVSGTSSANGLLNRYVCVGDFTQAFSKRSKLMDGQEFITNDGCLIGKNSVRVLGLNTAQDGVVARREKIEALECAVSVSEGALKVASERLAQEVDRSSLAKGSVVSAQQNLNSVTQEIASARARLAALDVKREQLGLRLQRVVDDVSVSQARSEEFIEMQLVLTGLVEEGAVSFEQLIDQRARHAESKEQLQAATDGARRDSHILQSKLHAASLNKQAIEGRLESLAGSYSDALRQQVVLEESYSALLEESVDFVLVEELQARLQDELVGHEREEKKLGALREEQELLQGQLRNAEIQRERAESELVGLRQKLEDERLHVQALNMEQQQKIALVSELGFQLADVLEQVVDGGLQSAGLLQELDKLGNKVQRLGPINLAAVDEYETQFERKNYLDEQNDELVDALEMLEAAIRKIDKETRTRFKNTYEQVNAGLQDLFPKIFGGGSAKLELTDSDLLETGVSIIARPPGKNNSTIHLLSGGEKALTALALIFSIFKLNPAPFCMLDEVDAPLDDANVARFARLVKEMSSTVQFIYISHNKVSMEMADQLMGVTMHEPGVSRLVSVDIDAATQLVEA